MTDVECWIPWCWYFNTFFNDNIILLTFQGKRGIFHWQYLPNSPRFGPPFFAFRSPKWGTWYLVPDTFLVSPPSRFQESWCDTFVRRKQAAGHWLAWVTLSHQNCTGGENWTAYVICVETLRHRSTRLSVARQVLKKHSRSSRRNSIIQITLVYTLYLYCIEFSY